MRLTKELKTPHFENVFQQALANITYTYHWRSQNLKQLLSPYQLTQQQHKVLMILFDQYPQPSTINLLKKKIYEQASDTSRMVDRLIQKGFVLKKTNPYDKRAVDIIISDKGLELLRKLDQEVDLSNASHSKLTEEEARQLNALLDKYRG
ncbi:MarR family protein [compost metagenome]